MKSAVKEGKCVGARISLPHAAHALVQMHDQDHAKMADHSGFAWFAVTMDEISEFKHAAARLVQITTVRYLATSGIALALAL